MRSGCRLSWVGTTMTIAGCRRPVRRGRISAARPSRVLPYPDDDAPLPPPTGLFGAPERRPAPAMATSLMATVAAASVATAATTGAGAPAARIMIRTRYARRAPLVPHRKERRHLPRVMTLPPEDQPETGKPKELPANLKKQLVDFSTKEPAGTIVIDTPNTYLYLVLGNGKAMRYGIGVGREGFTWAGTERVCRMKEWPDWFPPSEMIDRQPYLPRMMAGGPGNPLGARALYLGKTLYRIHGTNQPSTIGSLRVVWLHPPAQ